MQQVAFELSVQVRVARRLAKRRSHDIEWRLNQCQQYGCSQTGKKHQVSAWGFHK